MTQKNYQNISKVKSFFWVEDHICLKNKKDYLFECVKEMKKFSVDQMLYSFWHKGNYLKGLNGKKKGYWKISFL